MRREALLCAFAVLIATVPLSAQPKKPVAKDPPRVLVALPLGIAPGKPAKVTLRGLKLDGAKGVRLAGKGTVKLLKASKVAVPAQMEADRVGNSEVEVEVNVPADAPGDFASLIVATPGGESTPHKLLLDRTPVVMEKEPNDGFAASQGVSLGQTVQGGIERAQDVDVFAFEGKAGQKVVLEIHAARLGSALDSFLTLHDADGQIIASNDDSGGSVDSRIEATLPRGGKYFVTVIDVHDTGGPVHVYRLKLLAK